MPVAPKLIAASALPESARVRIRLRFKSRRIPCALGRTTRKTQTLSNGNTRSIGYQYDASGTASTSVTHQYDAAGNLQTDGLHQYHYDSQGRLQSSQTGQGPDAPTTRYAHNALGQRVFKTEPLFAAASSKDGALDDEEEDPSLLQTLVDFFTRLWNPAKSDAEHLGWAYLYDEDGSLLGEYGMGGAQSAGQSQYIYLPTAQGPIPIAAEIDNRPYAIHTDHLGTPRRLTQADGQAAWQWAYTPYGDEAPTLGAKRFTNETTNPTTGATNIAPVRFNLRYPGQYFDEESGLHYNYFRSYDPRTGRYTQSDPIGLDGGWNRFAYVGGSSLMFTDPKGLQAVPTPWGPMPLPPPIPNTGAGGGRGSYDPKTDTYTPSGTNSNNDSCCSSYTDVYEANDGKHGSTPRGNISAEPSNPSFALQNSIGAGRSKIGYDGLSGQIVVFRLTRTDEQKCIKYWHGYVVYQQDLTPEQWKAGRDAGFPNWPRKPK